MADIVVKIRISNEKIKEGEDAMEKALEGSSSWKRAKALVAKHKKLLIKYEKLNRKAMTFN